MKMLRQLLLPLVLLCSLPACGSGGGGGSASGGGDQAAGSADRYEVRGLVQEVGGEGADARATVAHEAIPTFKDRKGNASGMNAMTMAFGIGPAVDRAVLSEGAKVEMIIEVDWDKRPAITITKATALPAETELTL